MTRNINPTYNNSMFELKFTFFGKDEKLYVQDDIDRVKLEFLFFCGKLYKKILCFTKKNIKCPVCGENLNSNGTTNRLWNKKIPIKLQNYYHKKCKKGKTASLEKFKDKHCCYNREIRQGGTTSSLMSYKSYGSKSEELKHYYKVKIRPSTIYYSEITSFWKDYQELIERQKAEIKRLGIKPSGHFGYDEQYVFVNKKLYLRMTIIDIINKLIIAEQLVSEDEFNDEIIKKFLEDNIDQETVESITTDGRKSYKTIIQAVGALHHRCFFHLMQNLMMPLTRHINKIKRNIQKGENNINKNNKEIEERKQRYPKNTRKNT